MKVSYTEEKPMNNRFRSACDTNTRQPHCLRIIRFFYGMGNISSFGYENRSISFSQKIQMFQMKGTDISFHGSVPFVKSIL